MVIEVGAVVGYLASQLLRGTRKTASMAVEELLDELAGVVTAELGGKSLAGLRERPRDAHVRKRLGDRISAAARQDPMFADQLAHLLAELDTEGGPWFFNHVQAHTNAQAFGGGHAVVGNLTIVDMPNPNDLTGAPGWVKFFIGLGGLVCLAGMAIFGYTLFTDVAEANVNAPPTLGPPPGIVMAAAVFFAGFVMLGIGAFGRSVSHDRR